jgi:hypothetical protein
VVVQGFERTPRVGEFSDVRTETNSVNVIAVTNA